MINVMLIKVKCQCGNVLRAGSTVVASYLCSTRCAGNVYTFCGGAGLTAVYTSESVKVFSSSDGH